MIPAALLTVAVIVGVPTERKPGENRVALTPDGVRELVAHGHQVRVERGAGEGSSIPDSDFKAAGAQLVTSTVATGLRRDSAGRVIGVHTDRADGDLTARENLQMAAEVQRDSQP